MLTLLVEYMIDFRKAFDTVDYEILIQKLNHNGIRRVVNNWFSSFFQKIFQCHRECFQFLF